VGELAELEPAEQDLRLAAIPDPSLRQAVRTYLAALDTGSTLFERPAAAWLADGQDPEATDPAARLDERLGSWRIVRFIGQGGMGSVYEAEREMGGFTQRAAIKLVRADLAPGTATPRFRQERQLLARLQHRNIATLLDGGVTEDGRPWFAMELVDGQPITTWCSDRRLGPVERVRLFRQACAAVQHAHRELIVHRDLKPANFLVTEDGTVKLLDFGIAKLLDPTERSEADLSLTRGAGMPATLSYASPEQLAGGSLSTASDIYSLGVVLYELLTGTPPFPLGQDVQAHRRRVLEDPAPPMASRVTDTIETGWSIARLRRWLRGDIERVVQMALRKEPERRYASAEQLAMDLENVLTGRPVLARPDGTFYRVRRFVGRNPVAATVTAGLAVGLVVATGAAINRAHRAEQARVAATTAAERAEHVTRFLADVLAASDPWTGNRDVTVREVLDRASRRAATDFGSEPLVEEAVRLALARSYHGLGRLSEAEREYRAASTLGSIRSASKFEIFRGLGELSAEREAWAESRAWYDSAATIARAAGDSLGIASVAADLAWFHGLRGQADSARQAALRSLALRRDYHAPPADLANALNNLAVVELQSGRPDSALGSIQEAIALLRKSGPEGEPPLAAALATLAGIYSDRQDFGQAERYYRESLALRRRIFGVGHPDEIGTLINLAATAVDAERAPEALAITDTILARIGPGGLPPTHNLVAAARTVRGRALNALGRYRDAEGELRQALTIRHTVLPPGHPAFGFTLTALSDALAGQRRMTEALSAATEAWQLEAAGPDPNGPRAAAAAARVRRLAQVANLALPRGVPPS
jgi:serine/threonine-protein kinase